MGYLRNINSRLEKEATRILLSSNNPFSLLPFRYNVKKYNLMRPIEIRLAEIAKKHPHWSSWSCFIYIINGKGVGKQTISKLFDKLVDKNDYAKNERKELINYLLKLQTKILVKKDRIITTYNDPCFTRMPQDARLRESSSIEH